jgi:hypothetical protein
MPRIRIDAGAALARDARGQHRSLFVRPAAQNTCEKM